MGLNKPIIISTSAVDTSNLATKSDMTTLQNSVTSALANVGGGVKSIQRVMIASTDVSSNGSGGTLNEEYKDYTISSVDTTKAYIIPNGATKDSEQLIVPCCELINATTVRVYWNRYNSNKYYVVGGFTVIEVN